MEALWCRQLHQKVSLRVKSKNKIMNLLKYKVTLSYLIVILLVLVYVFTTNGDTPIIPALLTLIPWGFVLPRSLIDTSELALPLINIFINGGIVFSIEYLIRREA